MKTKFTTLIFVLLMLTALVACGKKVEETTNVETMATAVETTEEPVPGVEKSIFEGNEWIGEADAQTTAAEGDHEESEPTESENVELKLQENKTTGHESAETQTVETESLNPESMETETATSKTEYEKYIAMSGEEQKAFLESFSSIESFFEWLDNAKAEHDKVKPDIEINADGSIDLSKIAGK